MSIKVKAICNRETFKSGDYRIHSWSLLEKNDSIILSKYGTFSTKGENTFITEGKEYELEIELISSNIQWGGTYQINSVPSMNNLNLSALTREESFDILMDCTSSERIANNILDAYENFIEIIMTEGKEAIDTSKIKGVGEVYLNAYAREITNKYKYYHLLQEFKDYKVDVTDCKALCEVYFDSETIHSELSKNPYKILIETLKRPFNRADELIIELRPDLIVSEQRCAYLMLDVISKNESNGDTKLDANDLYYYLIDNYNMGELTDLIVPTAKTNPLFFYNENDKTIASSLTYSGECLIASFVIRKIKDSTKLDIDYTKYTETRDGVLTEEQSNILKTQCESNIAIINAKGGTGKSATLMASIKMCEDNGLSYILLSPTGRVAQRIKELTNREAYTIHRACLSSSLNQDVIFVEEFSMIGVDLLCMLINAIENKNARIYFNGDIGQIASISCGCPMRDMLDSGIVPVCTLTKVFRYGEGGLYKMATDAYDKKFYLSGIDYDNKNRISIGKNNDYTYVRYDGTMEQIIEEYKTLYFNRKVKSKDIAVITPWNVTEFGSVNINNEIQKIVNPDIIEDKFVKTKYINGRYSYDILLKVGDLILNTKNCYKIPTYEGYKMMKSDNIFTIEDVETTSVMNGEIGTIRDIDNGNIIAQFGEELIVFDKMMRRELLLGYSLTSYKLQGSECPYVITLITPQFSKSLSKNIIYTDMSRARKEVVEIIDPVVLAEKITIDTTEDRLTNLKELLLNYGKKEN